MRRPGYPSRLLAVGHDKYVFASFIPGIGTFVGFSYWSCFVSRFFFPLVFIYPLVPARYSHVQFATSLSLIIAYLVSPGQHISYVL